MAGSFDSTKNDKSTVDTFVFEMPDDNVNKSESMLSGPCCEQNNGRSSVDIWTADDLHETSEDYADDSFESYFTEEDHLSSDEISFHHDVQSDVLTLEGKTFFSASNAY